MRQASGTSCIGKLSVLIAGLALQLALRRKGKGRAFCLITNDFLLLHAAVFVTGLLLPVL
jgi:hypothetical protein